MFFLIFRENKKKSFFSGELTFLLTLLTLCYNNLKQERGKYKGIPTV